MRVSGIVSEMGTVADKTANYQIKITIDPVANVDIGMFADVHIPLQKGNTIVPINAVNIVDNNRGQIYLWNGTSLEVKTVVLGNIYGNGIEVIDELPQEMELVVSDLSNYDPESMTLKKK